jgi:hypothetical protein
MELASIRLLIALLAAPTTSGTGMLVGLSGPYLGQKTPGAAAELFAPGIVSTGLQTRDIAMTPDGTEIYFCVVGGRYDVAAIVGTRQVSHGWTVPEVETFSGRPSTIDLEPHISPDGTRFFFMSNRPRPGKPPDDRNEDLWVMERAQDGWGEPRNLGAPVNSEVMETFPSVTRDQTLYFGRGTRGGENVIWRARRVNDRYAEPERLPSQVNAGRNRFNAFVSPDESFLILSIVGLPDASGPSDYYICFRSADNRWSDPVNLGELVNQPGTHGFSPFVSPDGKWFFFMSDRLLPTADGRRPLTLSRWNALHSSPGTGSPGIWWMDASFISRLRGGGAAVPQGSPNRGEQDNP